MSTLKAQPRELPMHTITRTYRQRGKQISLQELDEVAAVRSDERRPFPSVYLTDLGPQGALAQVRAFEDAGWSFVPRGQAVDGAKVYIKPSGRVALGTNRLTVRVSRDHSDAEAKDLLCRHGVSVVDQLKFAPNLFVVTVPAGHDPLEAAEDLAGSGGVEFAEPELVEVVPGR